MRKRRQLQNNAVYHVIAKANRGEFLLESKEVKEMLLDMFARARKKYSFTIKNFSIMSNHLHIIIKPGKGESLSRIMQWILGVSAKKINKYFDFKGHVWYDRFKSVIIETYRQLLATFQYVCNNPVKANMVEKAEDHRYGGLWFIRHKRFELVERPGPLIKQLLSEYF